MIFETIAVMAQIGTQSSSLGSTAQLFSILGTTFTIVGGFGSVLFFLSKTASQVAQNKATIEVMRMSHMEKLKEIDRKYGLEIEKIHLEISKVNERVVAHKEANQEAIGQIKTSVALVNQRVNP